MIVSTMIKTITMMTVMITSMTSSIFKKQEEKEIVKYDFV
jgi:hypothetical protein